MCLNLNYIERQEARPYINKSWDQQLTIFSYYYSNFPDKEKLRFSKGWVLFETGGLSSVLMLSHLKISPKYYAFYQHIKEIKYIKNTSQKEILENGGQGDKT